MQKYVAPKLRETFVVLDAALVVDLREDLDVARERKYGPRRLAENEVRHVVRIRRELVPRRHARRGQRLDAPEQFLVLQLLVAETDERLQGELIREPMVLADLEHLRGNEALDEAENVCVRSALHLA